MMNGPAKKAELLPKKEPPQWLKRLRTVYKSNTFLVVFSVLGAILLWSVLVASDGTLTREKTFTDVPVTMSGLDTLKSNGYIVVDNVDDILASVRMTVEVTQDNYSRVTAGNYSPRIDVSRIRASGEQVVDVTFASTTYGRVIECEPSSVVVHVERYVPSNRIPVVVETQGKLASGLYIDTPRIDPSYISVSGPSSVIASIKRAVAKFDLGLLNGELFTQRSAVPFVLEDEKGNEIDTSLLRITYQSIVLDKITVETDVYRQKALPIETNGIYIGEPAAGFEVKSVRIVPETVLVAAREEVLEQLTAAVLDAPVDITDATGPQSVTARIKKLSDAQNMNIGEALVQIDIGEKTLERSFKRVPITVTGAQETQKVTLSSSSANVQLTGPYRFMNALEAQDITLSVDVTGLQEGEHTLDIRLHIANAPELESVLSITNVTAAVSGR